MNGWRGVEEYRPEMGRVVVWVSTTRHTAAGVRDDEGVWKAAYFMTLNDGGVWVDAAFCTPLEEPGARVTHFLNPVSPFPSRVERISRALWPEGRR